MEKHNLKISNCASSCARQFELAANLQHDVADMYVVLPAMRGLSMTLTHSALLLSVCVSASSQSHQKICVCVCVCTSTTRPRAVPLSLSSHDVFKKSVRYYLGWLLPISLSVPPRCPSALAVPSRAAFLYCAANRISIMISPFTVSLPARRIPRNLRTCQPKQNPRTILVHVALHRGRTASCLILYMTFHSKNAIA